MQTNIYWEKQGLDMLCGVHCINSVLQGPFFSEVTLAQFALELDKKQRELMLEQGMTKDFLKYMGEESGNVAMDGNYSVQVLHEGLKTLNLTMVSIESFKEGEDMAGKTGFICNSSAHWFALRKIKKVWYNLNSTNRRMPEVISDFYLSAFLLAVKNSGYQIFSIEGDYPESSEDRFDFFNKNQLWIEAKRIEKYHQKCIKRKGFRPNIGDGRGDKEMEKALAISMGKKFEQYVSSGEDSDWNEQKKPELKQFGGVGASMSQEVTVNYAKFHMPEEEIEMSFIIKQSLEDQFKEEPKSGKLVIIRYPNGKKEQRIFQDSADIESLYDYVWCKRPGTGRFYLINYENKEKLVDVSIPLFAIVDQDNSAIIIVNDQ